MSHCRHLFSRGYLPQLTCRRLEFAHRSFSNVATDTSRFECTRARNFAPKTFFRRAAMSKHLSTSITDTSLRSKELTSTLVDEEAFLDEASITGDVYQELRQRDRHLVSKLPTECYSRVFGEALAKSSSLADDVAMDIVEVYRGSDSNRSHMLLDILANEKLPMLHRPTVLSILECFKDAPDKRKIIPEESMNVLVREIVRSPSSNPLTMNLLLAIYPIFCAHLLRHKPPGGVQLVDYYPPNIIHTAFAYMHKLLDFPCQQEALQLFQILVDSGYVPREVVQGLDSSSTDFSAIVCMALAKACLHWNWKNLPILVISGLLKHSHTPHQSVIDVTFDVIYALLDNPTGRSIRGCTYLVSHVHRHAPVSDSIIRQIYTAAAELSEGDVAERLYEFSRTPSIVEQHFYPPPHGIALPWFMHYLSTDSRKTHLSRQLASEVVQDNLPIPLQTRADFILNTAAQSYATFARELWERYAASSDNHVIVGNSALMIRMVSLFTSLRRRLRDTCVDEEAFVRQSEDYTTFLTQILQSYRVHHMPLIKAPHQALTSLARACFMVGKYTEGLEVFKVLLQRKEIPDIYDINVALTAVAEAKPRLAASLIKRMVQKGMRPDSVTFSTVMHHAFLRGDLNVVNQMIEGIRGLKDVRWTLPTVDGLIRATINSGMPGSQDLKSRLQTVLKMVEFLKETTTLSSPQTGKYLVYVSLRENEVMAAYSFWDIFLRHGAEWDDDEQRQIRRRIAQGLKQQSSLDKSQMTTMLTLLGMIKLPRETEGGS